MYRVDAHDWQPFFFDIEGYVDIYHLDLLIAGSYEGRLQWTTASNPLLCHSLDRKDMKIDFFQDKNPQGEEIKDLTEKENMYRGLDPVESDGKIENLMEEAKSSSERDEKVFTLVDTYTMAVTLFEAVRPPMAVVLCGEEGGMQRFCYIQNIGPAACCTTRL